MNLASVFVTEIGRWAIFFHSTEVIFFHSVRFDNAKTTSPTLPTEIVGGFATTPIPLRIVVGPEGEVGDPVILGSSALTAALGVDSPNGANLTTPYCLVVALSKTGIL